MKETKRKTESVISTKGKNSEIGNLLFYKCIVDRPVGWGRSVGSVEPPRSFELVPLAKGSKFMVVYS